jgi:putative PIN family toxin of toxin-antitoxin system
LGKSSLAPIKVVLDTNVVLDLVVFRDPAAEPIRLAVESGRVALLSSTDCLDELRRVLSYPEFGLDAARQASALEWYESRLQRLEAPPVKGRLPHCRDADDQKFLDLAWAANAAHLVTKDKALLVLARRIAKLGRFLVSSPTEVDWGKG